MEQDCSAEMITLGVLGFTRVKYTRTGVTFLLLHSACRRDETNEPRRILATRADAREQSFGPRKVRNVDLAISRMELPIASWLPKNACQQFDKVLMGEIMNDGTTPVGTNAFFDGTSLQSPTWIKAFQRLGRQRISITVPRMSGDATLGPRTQAA